MNKPIISIITVLILAAGIGGYFIFKKPAFPEPQPAFPGLQKITTFEECAKAGYPVTMSHPRACRAPDGRTFTEKVTPASTEKAREEKTEENKETNGKSQTIPSINFLKKVDVGAGARPEVVATQNRVFVVYHDLAVRGSAYSVKIYDKDMTKEIAYKVLIQTSTQYGKPTDIRVASDGKYLYAFYETVLNFEVAYLWGAKYTLDDKFERVADTKNYIAKDKPEGIAEPGDELVNDPMPLIGPNSVFVITRLEQASHSQGVPVIYRVYEFSNDLQKKLSQLDLDLSNVATGGSRQASVSYYNGYYYMVVPTTSKSGNYVENMATPSDLLLIKFDKNWKIVKTQNLSQNHEDIETFVLGFQIHQDLFFVTYKQGMPFVCPLNVYDQNHNLVSSTIVRKAAGRGESLRSALEVTDDRIYVGLERGQGPPPPGAKDKFGSSGESPVAEIYIYEKR